MFEKSTLFILGAGASAPYDYPTGDRLRKSIVTSLWEVLSNTTYDQEKPLLPDKAVIKNFCDSLDKSDDLLIDYFLETCNNSEFVRIGKIAILKFILQAELESSVKRNVEFAEDDWFPVLFGKITEGVKCVEDLALNRVNFITFNYDRLLEHRLVSAVKHKFGVSWEESYRAFENIQIIHVFGRLPDLFFENNNGYQYGKNILLHQLVEHLDEIKTIHERSSINTSNISGLISGADSIYFLGFGYNEENLNLLNIKSNLCKETNIYGTAYRINETKINSIKHKIWSKRLQISPGLLLPDPIFEPNLKCREFLEKHL